MKQEMLEPNRELFVRKPKTEKGALKMDSSPLREVKLEKPRKFKGETLPLGELFMCPNCTKSYRLKHSLTRHIKYECGIEPKYNCPACDRKFKHKYDLSIHVKTKHSFPMLETILTET